MPHTSDREIAAVLRTVKTIALLGASDRPDRPSHRVLRFLLDTGYTVLPVNPTLAGQSVRGQRVYPDLASLPCPVDMVDVFRRLEHLPDVVAACKDLGVKVLWTQLGVVHEAALRDAEAMGMQVIADRCPAIEWPRLERAGLLG